MATISDRRIQVDTNSDGTVDSYKAGIATANDYYPFGMLMPQAEPDSLLFSSGFDAGTDGWAVYNAGTLSNDNGRLKFSGSVVWSSLKKDLQLKTGKQYRVRFTIDMGNCKDLHVPVYKSDITSYEVISGIGISVTSSGTYEGTFTATSNSMLLIFEMIPGVNPPPDSTGYYWLDNVSVEEIKPGDSTHFYKGGYRYGFNGKENDNDIDNSAQDYGMRIYDGRLGRFLSVDPLTPKYPELTPYQFASNTPIQAIDLDGKEAFFIHGTASGPQAWSPKLTNFIVKNLTNNIHSDATFSWQDRNGYLNNETDRKNAAFDLVLHIMDYREKNKITDEEITLIGHSHGGNVAIQATHYLNDIYGITVNIIDFNTPAYGGSKDPENPQVGYGINQLIHFWTKQDGVGGGLAGDDKYKDGVRTDVKNIELDKPLKKGPLESHFLENINLDELNSKKVKPTPVPTWEANPTHDKYDPNWKPPVGATNNNTNTQTNSNSISPSATTQ